MLLSSKYSETADIYSLGLLFIEVYIEKNPFHLIPTTFIYDLLEKYKKKEMVFFFFLSIYFFLFFLIHFIFFLYNFIIL